MKQEQPILVAIRCTVYNHEPYLRDCLEGFVMQKTNFRFVAVVHDDASTDKSADIIREYAEKYPDIIKPIYEIENQYSKQDGSLGRIMNAAIDATGAKYIATCEGDDYWIDPCKLQKQVDFLENHPDFSICFHPVIVYEQRTGKEFPDNLAPVPPVTTIENIAKIGNYIHYPSAMYVNIPKVDQTIGQLGKIGVSDYLQFLLLSQYGNICKLPDYMAVYRQGVGVWSGNRVPYRTEVQWLIAISKLLPLLENDDAKKLLDEQITEYSNSILNGVHDANQQLLQIRSSKAYRLGKLLLKPFRWMKRLVKKLEKNQ